MTEIMVSRRDGVAREPSGVQHRVYRGKTLADARHPLVQANPQDWSPMEIHLPVEGPETAEAADPERPGNAEVEEERDAYREQLAAIVVELSSRGYRPAADDVANEGWLARLVGTALDTNTGNHPASEDVPTPLAPPPPPRRSPATRAKNPRGA